MTAAALSEACRLYILDHQMAAVASGQIGDDDWLSFVEQLKESATGSDTVD